MYSDKRSPKRFIISFLTGARCGFLRIINAIQAYLSFPSGRGFIGITLLSRLALSIYARPGLFSRWGDCGKMSRHCEGHWQFRALLELAGEPSPRTARGHAKWHGDKSLKSSNEDATNMRSCMHSLVGYTTSTYERWHLMIDWFSLPRLWYHSIQYILQLILRRIAGRQGAAWD